MFFFLVLAEGLFSEILYQGSGISGRAARKDSLSLPFGASNVGCGDLVGR